MKKLLFKLFFIFAAFLAVACFSCKNSSDSNDDFYIENPDDKKEENKNPAIKPKAKIFVQSKSSHEICIYSDIERQNLVAQIPSNASATFETEQIGEAIFYYTFLISLEQDSGVKVPFHDNSCAFLLATSANEESAQTISFPKSIALSSCFVILKNDGEKAIQFMSENFVINPSKTEGTASAIINPGKSACYEIQKKNFDNLGAYSVRETLGTIAFPLKEKIGAFEECKIYTIVFDGNSIRLANAIGQEELVGMKAYSVTHKCERLDSEEYETSETETLYGFPQEMTAATAKKYEGFVADDFVQKEILIDGSTQIEICYKRIRTTLTFNANGGMFGNGSETKTISGKYGAEVSTPTPYWDDHLFLGWDAEVPKTFGAEDMAFGAKWEFSITKETTDATVYGAIKSCNNSLYTYTIKLKGYITEATLEKVAQALYENSSVSFVLDISEAYGITELPSYSFNYKTFDYQPCTNLFGIILNNEIKAIGENAFEKCTRLKSVEIPASVTVIGANAFLDCVELASVKISDGVKTIEEGAFKNCTNLKEVSIGSGMTTIGNSVFSGCVSLENVEIPASVAAIGTSAFERCTNLASVVVLAKEPSSLGADAFAGNANGRKTYVPSASIEKYKNAANWKNYAADIAGDCTLGKAHAYNDVWKNDATNHWKECIACRAEGHQATHVWNVGEVTKVATCIATGVRTYTCTVCGRTKTETIAAKGHTYSEWENDANSHWKKCVDCGAIGHQVTHGWNAGEVTKASTCTAMGIRTYTCATCGRKKTETIAAKGHIYSSTLKNDADNHWEECVDCGAKKNIIAHANAVYLKQTGEREVKCSACGFVASTDAWTAETLSELSDALKNYAETEVNIKVAGEITNDDITTIKSALTANKTKKVALDLSGTTGLTEIADNAFYNYSNLTNLVSVKIPDGVKIIGVAAFRGCINFASITMPSSVTSIGSSAFQYCTSLESVTFAQGSKLETIGDYAFKECASLTSVTIPSSVTSMGNYVFENCTSLESVIIPNSVTEIGFDAFRECASLSSITLPNSITSINSGMFQDCTSLKSIIIPESVGNIIYDKAFKGCTRLASVTIFAAKPPYIGTFQKVFSNTNDNLKIYVPAESVEAYKAKSGWKECADKIFAIEEE